MRLKMKPVRIQRKRTKGYDMQAESRAINGLECVYVGRGTPYGNPWKVENGMVKFIGEHQVWIEGAGDISTVIKLYREHILRNKIDLSKLRFRNVSCFCRLDQECHADVLLEFANAAEKGE